MSIVVADPLSFRTSSKGIPGWRFARSVLLGLNRLSKRWAYWRLHSEGLLDVLSDRPAHAFAIEADDLWLLYRKVRRRRPQLVLEFGSGYSTSVLAEAVRRNGCGRVVAIEAYSEWAAVTSKALAAKGLDHVAHVLTIPALPTELQGRAAWKHAHLPSGVAPDLIYLDGPPLDHDRPFAVDLLEVEQRLGRVPFTIIDGRKANFNFLRQHLRGSYRFRWHRIAYRAVIE